MQLVSFSVYKMFCSFWHFTGWHPLKGYTYLKKAADLF